MADLISPYFHFALVATAVSPKSLHFAFSSKCGSYHGARSKLWPTGDSTKVGNKRSSLQTDICASCTSSS
jgi:hypothetical protein